MKRFAAKNETGTASDKITQRIASYDDWRGETLGRIRALILAATPGVVEEWKWSIPVWSKDGILCTGETYKQVVKLTFPKGASLKDPARLFNSSLEGNARRAIDIREGEKVRVTALKALIREAAALNAAGTAKTKPTRVKPTKKKSVPGRRTSTPGNRS